jgi:glycosyltransferase involved in cell wall biosynthesis
LNPAERPGDGVVPDGGRLDPRRDRRRREGAGKPAAAAPEAATAAAAEPGPGDGGRIVETSRWRLRAPDHVSQDSPLVCVPTVHQRGDSRVLRCAQDALDAGFRVRLIWLSDDQDPSTDPAVGETLMRSAHSRADRLRVVARLAGAARREQADLWHIHDFYLLAQARRWRRQTGRPVIYDVHEYYGIVYSGKVRAPAAVRRWLARRIDTYQVRSARKLGAVNAAAEGIARTFASSGAAVVTTLNAPLGAPFLSVPLVPFSQRARRVVHIGTLNEDYGMRRVVRIAAEAQRRGLPHTFDLVDRFHNDAERAAFARYLEEDGDPANLRIIPAVPSHRLGELLSGYGVGLAVFSRTSQNDLSMPGKLFEYSVMGLAIVCTDAPAQQRFAQQWAVARPCAGENVGAFVDALEDLDARAVELDAAVADKAALARRSLTWEAMSAPKLRGLYRELRAQLDGAG